MEAKYLKYKKEREADLSKKERESKILGYTKLLLVIILAAALWIAFRRGVSLVKVVIIAADLLLSVWLWIRHGGVCRQVDYIKGLVSVADRYLARIDGEWSKFSDDGVEYMDYNHPYTNDLDIFGPKSAFQFLNVTNTAGGRGRFHTDLAEPDYDESEIKRRQGAIKELADLDGFSHDFQCCGSFIKDKDNIASLTESMGNREPFIKNEWLKMILHYMPFVFFPVSILIFIFRISALYPTAIVLLGIQLILWLVFAVKANRYLGIIGKLKYGLEQYSELFELLEKQEFESELLRELKISITGSGYSASAAIKKLGGVMQRVEARSNALLFIALNVLLLWDIGCCMALEKWQDNYAPHFGTWISQLGEIESLISFSVISNVVSGTSYPEIAQRGNGMSARTMGHPLIPDAKRVCNDFNLEDDIIIISGSNMSGKTTFLRTIGLNLVLAKCGSPVCAGQMQFSNMQIATSMRISDDLNEGISTFYAELKKIKAIINMAEEKRNVIFLIDEIFRGTNSADRMAGARAVIKKLNSLGACGLMTTHDLAMCKYTDGADIKNYHFSEQYHDGKLIFDYKVRSGIAKTTNGQFLMKMIGILD